jgi:DNA-binding SARP family transcriptional activator
MGTENVWNLRLLGGWQLLSAGHPVKVALRQQRVLAALALFGRQHRSSLAGLLWPDSTEAHAAGSLRGSIFHMNRQFPGLLEHTLDSVAWPVLSVSMFDRLRTGPLPWMRIPGSCSNLALLEDMQDADLLPGWYENWVVAEQERWLRLRLSALERLARLLLAGGSIGAAMEASCAAVAIEPLRESAQRLRIQCYLAEGNNAAALSAYVSFSRRLRQEFGVPPSPLLGDLIAPLLADSR